MRHAGSSLVVCAVLLGLALVPPRLALAAWPSDPLVNVPLSTAANDQYYPMLAADGVGGAIVTWNDGRNGTNLDIYAQHVLASGAVDPTWPADGRALCTAAGNQVIPWIVSDGAGGAIVSWSDARSDASDVYAQHVLANGTVDTAWPADGRALCTAAGDQQNLCVTSDGSGGAIVAWDDRRSGTNLDVYAQHVLAGGAVDPAWPANGRAVCTAVGDQMFISIVSDGTGNAVLAWGDGRGGVGYDVYAQRVLAGGTVDPAWPADGRALCTAVGDQNAPKLVSDGAGGAVVTWNDRRSGSSHIYAQHVLASGTVDPAWPTDGRGLCLAANDQSSPLITSDDAGGAIVTWTDTRSDYDIYAQHVLASGAVDPVWPANGRAVCSAANIQQAAALIPDGSGGAVVAWVDYRSGSQYDIYAQHVTAGGTPDPLWPLNGRALCTAAGSQGPPRLIPDGAGGAIATWDDRRGGTSYDIYAQRVTYLGQLGAQPVIASVRDVPNDQGGKVKVAWYASCIDVAPDYGIASYWIWRSVPPNDVALALDRGANLMVLDEPGLPYGRAPITTSIESGLTVFWEYVGSQIADGDAGYSFVMSTTSDSVSTSNPYTLVRVQARATGGSAFWNSAADSGYSVDNLSPLAPTPFTGLYVAGRVMLHWGANPEADLAYYRLYRGSSASFVPGPGNRVAELSNTEFVDTPGAPCYYKLCAVDLHGNASGFALVLPSGTSDVPADASHALALDGVRPNPSYGEALTVAFTLPTAAHASLELLDVGGRRLAAREVGSLGAGRHVVELATNRHLAPGLHMLKLTQGANVKVTRVVVLN